MKVHVATIAINGESKLHVLLLPETPEEEQFLETAFDECVGYEFSFEKIGDVK